jgi:hypothetical protein
MQIRRFVRSLMVAGPMAVLGVLSVVSTVLACTGGPDWPRVR